MTYLADLDFEVTRQLLLVVVEEKVHLLVQVEVTIHLQRPQEILLQVRRELVDDVAT